MNWTTMTFNLRLNVASDGPNAWPLRVEAAAEAIKRGNADFVCVQEGLYAMLADLEPLLPDYAWIGEGREGGREGESCAIFYKKSKWRAEEFGHFGLSETPERLGAKSWNTDCPRMCTWGLFASSNGERVAVFNTHLDHVSEEAQTKGMELIRERIDELRERAGVPVVLTGDFNVGPDHAVVRGLEAAGYRNAYSVLPGGTDAAGATYHDFRGGEEGEPIDYAFATPDVGIEAVEVDRGQYGGRYPSDHYPVVVKLSA